MADNWRWTLKAETIYRSASRYTLRKLSKRDIKKTILFTIATTTENNVPGNKFNQGGKKNYTRKIIR